MLLANELAYFVAALMTKKKRFITLTPGRGEEKNKLKPTETRLARPKIFIEKTKRLFKTFSNLDKSAANFCHQVAAWAQICFATFSL